MKTNPDLLYEILMEEMIELRTPDPSQCICVKCQKEKSDYADRVIPRILKEFKRKTG
jgi:hypothetical protein